MSDGTQYNSMSDLIDSIKALVFTNNSNEVSADDEQTAMLNIVETIFPMLEASLDHSNFINTNISGHPIEAIDNSGLGNAVSLESTDYFLSIKDDNTWFKTSVEELLSMIASAELPLTNKTINLSENTLNITLDDVAETANRKHLTTNDKANLTTLTNGSNADSLHKHASQTLEYIENISQLQTFLTTAGTKQGIVIKPLTITTSLYVTGTKYLYGEDIIIEDLPDIGVTNTINLYISNNVVLGADNVDTVVYNPNMSANIHFNTIKPIGNTAKSFTLAPTSSGSFNATYAFAPGIVSLSTNINKDILDFKPLPAIYTETGSEYVYTIIYNIDNGVTMEISYLANPSLPIELNVLPKTTDSTLLVFEMFEDVVTNVSSPGSASWNLPKFYNNTTEITVGLMGGTVGDYQRMVLDQSGGLYYGSLSTSSINLNEEALVFTTNPLNGHFSRKLTLKGRLSKTEY